MEPDALQRVLRSVKWGGKAVSVHAEQPLWAFVLVVSDAAYASLKGANTRWGSETQPKVRLLSLKRSWSLLRNPVGFL